MHMERQTILVSGHMGLIFRCSITKVGVQEIKTNKRQFLCAVTFYLSDSVSVFFVNVLKSLDGAEGLKPIQNNSIVFSSVDCPHDYLQNQVMCLCPY